MEMLNLFRNIKKGSLGGRWRCEGTISGGRDELKGPTAGLGAGCNPGL